MEIKLNGEKVELEKELTVTELLEIEDVDMPDMVSVELNGEILKRDNFPETKIQKGDKVEFLYFMGGGAK